MDTLTEILELSVHDMGNDMEKTIEQHRAEFEEWMLEINRSVDRYTYTGYSEYSTSIMWSAWKAARGIKE